MVDVILTTFQSHPFEIESYFSHHPHEFLFYQPPTQFKDDTYVFSNSMADTQNAIQLLQTAEPILNIRINPTKTRHFSLDWEFLQKKTPNHSIPSSPQLHPYMRSPQTPC